MNKIDKDPNAPETSDRLTDLMDKVDSSFPEFPLPEDWGHVNIDTMRQHLWARSQEWNHCLEELCVIMFAEIPNSHHMYYIGREFKG